MKQCIHLKYDRDRAMHSFISSSTPFNVKKKVMQKLGFQVLFFSNLEHSWDLEIYGVE